MSVYRILGERGNSRTGKGLQTGTNPREFRRRMFSVGRVDPCPLWNLRRFTLCVSNRRTGEARRRPFGTCHSYSPPIPRFQPGESRPRNPNSPEGGDGSVSGRIAAHIRISNRRTQPTGPIVPSCETYRGVMCDSVHAFA